MRTWLLLLLLLHPLQGQVALSEGNNYTDFVTDSFYVNTDAFGVSNSPFTTSFYNLTFSSRFVSVSAPMVFVSYYMVKSYQQTPASNYTSFHIEVYAGPNPTSFSFTRTSNYPSYINMLGYYYLAISSKYTSSYINVISNSYCSLFRSLDYSSPYNCTLYNCLSTFNTSAGSSTVITSVTGFNAQFLDPVTQLIEF